MDQRRRRCSLLVIAFLFLFTGCEVITPTPVVTPTATATSTSTPNPTATPTPPRVPSRAPAQGWWVFQANNLKQAWLDDPSVFGLQYEALWRQFNMQSFQQWMTQVEAAGKSASLRILIYQNRDKVNTGLPAHLAGRVWKSPEGWLVPRYDDTVITDELSTFIHDIAVTIGSDRRIAFVQVGTGLYGETHPERNDTQWQGATWLYEADTATGKKHRLEPCDWISFVLRVEDIYHSAFAPYNMPLVLMTAPRYGYPCLDPNNNYAAVSERLVIDEHWIALRHGFQNNSLDEWDANWFSCEVVGQNGPYMVDGSMQAIVDHPEFVNGGERGSWLYPFGKNFQVAHHQTSWSIYNALDKRMDFIFGPQYAGELIYNGQTFKYDGGLFGYPADAPYSGAIEEMKQFATSHMDGTADDYWTVFFQPPKGDYWGCTAQSRDHQWGMTPVPPYALVPVYNVAPIVPPFFEGKYARRTDQTNGISAATFAFNDDRVGWMVELWLLDNGTDSVSISFPNAQTVFDKRGTGEWIRVEIDMPDAAGGKITLDSLNDGPDEVYHRLLVKPLEVLQ